VVVAGDADHPEAHAALSSLCEDYWRPLYYFARHKGHSVADAQDLTQGFILGLLEQGAIAKADRERGRFRTFLLSSFCHYLANEHRRQSAEKRGGGVAPFSLDAESESGFLRQPVDLLTPERLYERTWALAVLDRVMGKLEAEYGQARRVALFETIRTHLSGDAGRTGYAQLGEKLGMSTSAVTVAVHRMRRRYGVLLREEVASTVATPEAVEEELRYLIQVVSSSPGRGGSL
jgi:RNA polymerase sigma-70 factor (ECF subfamily)